MATGQSLYLGDSIVGEVEQRASLYDRSWSEQVAWLLRLGLPRRRSLPSDPDSTKDDTRGRRYFYPPAALHNRVRELQATLNGDGPRRWSYSAVCRALLGIGMRTEDALNLQQLLQEPPCQPAHSSPPSSPSQTTTETGES